MKTEDVLALLVCFSPLIIFLAHSFIWYCQENSLPTKMLKFCVKWFPIFSLAIILPALANRSAFAAHHQKQVIVANAFAVPVGVPVSPYAPYAYSSSQQQQQAYAAPPRSAEDVLAERLAVKIAGKLGLTVQNEVKALEKPTAFSQSCAKCHAKGDSALGKPELHFDQLTEAQRLKSIDAIVHDRMPKGGKLSPEQAGALIRELSAKPKAADVPPPLPNPEGKEE